jgi:serine phosphatase RsbU (regulator of sigma subunit)
MVRQTMTSRNFVTVFAGVLDTQSHEFTYSSAGHDAVVVWNAGTGEQRFLRTKGQACGFTREELFDGVIEQSTTRIALGEMLVFNTDGITESKNMVAAEYTDERYWSVIQQIGVSASAEGALAGILQNIAEFVGDAAQYDDMTLLAMKRM